MPKGDKLKLKADPEDGTTPIANLLLEAVAMAKLSGLQKGAIIYLWRCTYGWVGEDGKRRKEAKVSLSEWARALDSASSRLSHALSELEDKSIINRRMADAWGGYYYSLNTTVANWNSNCLNLAKLAERVGVADFGSIDENAIPPQNVNSCETDNSSPKQQSTVDENAREQLPKTQPPTLYKERLKKDIKKEGLKISSPFGEDVAKVFFELDRTRGYRPSVKRKAEAASIIRMLKSGYKPGQILEVWQKLKRDKFWQDKELFMMSVESQIGAMVKGNGQTGQQKQQRKTPVQIHKGYAPADPED